MFANRLYTRSTQFMKILVIRLVEIENKSPKLQY